MWPFAWFNRKAVNSERQGPLTPRVQAIVAKLGPEFLTKLHKTTFAVFRKGIEDGVWRKLWPFVEAYLDQREFEKGKPVKTGTLDDKYSQAEIGQALGGMDQGLISKARSCKTAPLTFPALIKALFTLEKHWKNLEELASFENLTLRCLQHAVGFAQKRVNAYYHFPPPSATTPSDDEMKILMAGNPRQQDDPPLAAAWHAWGEGWLITQFELGLTKEVYHEAKR